MKIPAVVHNDLTEYGPYKAILPRLVMPQYRAMQGVKKPAVGTNQCRSNNGYKGGVLAPAFWKVTLNSVPSFYASIASLCSAIVHEIEFDSEVDAWPVLNKGTPAVAADPYHVPPIAASPEIPAYWTQVSVDQFYVNYLPVTDAQYGTSIRAIYANYTPYKPQPNRPAVLEAITGERNPDYVTATSYGDVVSLQVTDPGTGNVTGDVITFSAGTALYRGGDPFTILTNTGFQLQHEYTQTDSSGSGTGMKVLAYCTTKFSAVKLWNQYHNYKTATAIVCGRGFVHGEIITCSAGTAQVTPVGTQTIYETAGVLVQSVLALNELTDTWVSPTEGGWRDGHTYDQTGVSGSGVGGKVLATAIGFDHYDIVDGGKDFEVGDHIYIYDGQKFGGFDVATVDEKGAITSLSEQVYYRLTFEHTYGQSWAWRDSIDPPNGGQSPGTGCQVYMHPSYALTPQPTTDVTYVVIDTMSCGVGHRVGDILTFGGGGTAEVISIDTPIPSFPELNGRITWLKLTDTTGLEPFTHYMQTGSNGPGTGAGIFTDAICTVDRAGWPRYSVGVRSMKWDTYGQAQVTTKKLQIAVGLHIPRFSDRDTVNGINDARIDDGDWYPESYSSEDVYVAWGIEIDADMWPDVMRLDNLTLPLPFVGVSRTYYGALKAGNYGFDGAADWNGTTITLTRVPKPTDNYPGRPYTSRPRLDG